MTAHEEETLDEVLREAQDPTTSGERLSAIWHDVRRTRAITDALLTNPNAVPSQVCTWLAHHRDAWYNPLVPSLLMLNPSLRSQAAWLLWHESDGHVVASPHNLAPGVVAWRRRHPRDDGERRTRAFARHLAGLFGLPWPEETP